MNNYRTNDRSTQPMMEKFNPLWITQGIDKECVNFADKLGEQLTSGKLSTSQIRNIFGELKRIELRGFGAEKSAFYLLKPKMAYAAGRANNAGVSRFKEVFDEAFNAVDTDGLEADKHFKNFVDFFEAILAYHKAHGGKN